MWYSRVKSDQKSFDFKLKVSKLNTLHVIKSTCLKLFMLVIKISLTLCMLVIKLSLTLCMFKGVVLLNTIVL
jgi:hypothetical protein